MLKFFGSEKYLIGILIGVTFVLTVWVVILYNDRFLRPQLFKDEEFRMDPSYVEKWTHIYSQHLAGEVQQGVQVKDPMEEMMERELARLKYSS